ncbi:MAG: hypothetical protein WCL06_07595 [Bacteroidota bacterium]
MKNRTFIRLSAIALSCIMLITLLSCNMFKSKGDKKMKVNIQISIPDVIGSLALHKKDTVLQKSIALAKEAQNRSSEDFLILFGKAWEQFAEGKSLSTAFEFSSQSPINKTSTRDEVIEELSKMTDKLIDRTIQTIEKRMSGMDVKLTEVQKTKKRGELILTLEDVEFPQRVIYLIQFDGNLAFWETYEYKELFPYLDKADKKLAEILHPDAKTASETEPKDKSADTTEFGLPKENNSLEKYEEDHPLLAYLQPALVQDENGNYFPNKGPVVGYTLLSDTSRVNLMLKMPEIVKEFPPSLHFAWTVQAVGENKNTLKLIACKADYYGGPAMEAHYYITDSKWSVGQNYGNEIEIEMNAEGATIWKRITQNNIGKSIAIVLDGSVYSFPIVQAEIPGGRSSITGSFTPEEAQDMAWIFKTGGYPAHITIDKVSVYDKKGQPIEY